MRARHCHRPVSSYHSLDRIHDLSEAQRPSCHLAPETKEHGVGPGRGNRNYCPCYVSSGWLARSYNIAKVEANNARHSGYAQ